MNKNNENKLVPKLRFQEFKEEGNWYENNLDKVGEFTGGGTPDTSNPEYWNGRIQWFTPTEVKEGFVSKSERTITEEGLRNSAAKLLPIGALLITTRATIGDVAIAKEECATNQGFQSLVVNQDQDNRYWYYWIVQHKNELKRRSSGSTFLEIGKSEIARIIALSPKKKEQQKIAACLSSLDEVIKAESQRLNLLNDYKIGLLQNLLPQEGETVPNFRFSQFEENWDWKETTLTQVADYENGKAHEQDIDIDGDFIVVNSKFISQDGEVKKFSNTAFCLASKGDVLMVLSDIPNGKAIAKCFLVDEDNRYSVNQRICRITPHSLNNKILYFLLNRNPHFLAFDDGVKQTNLRKEDVLNCPLLIPSDPKEQDKIAETLSSIDDLINVHSQKVEALKLHKKGLLQGLFPIIINEE